MERELEAAPIKGSQSYLGKGHTLELWDKKIYTTMSSPFKGRCTAGDWSAIGTTKGEVRERWSQHLYGVMQKRSDLKPAADSEPKGVE